MRILSFNIWFGGERSLGKVANRRSLIQSVIRQEGPDILGLLECNGWTEDLTIFRDYEKSLGMRGFLLSTEKDTEGNAFNITLFIKPEIKVESVFMDAVHFWHGVIVAEVSVRGRPVTIVVTHLNPNSPTERLQEAGTILGYIPKNDCIIMGDLNSLSPADKREVADIPAKHRNRHVTNGEVDVSVIRQFEQSGLVDSFGYLWPGATDYTAPTSVADDPAFQGTKLRLDYIFLSDSLKTSITEARVVRTENSNLASDHFPVLVNLTI